MTYKEFLEALNPLNIDQYHIHAFFQMIDKDPRFDAGNLTLDKARKILAIDHLTMMQEEERVDYGSLLSKLD